jgi:hypothetical protein
MTTAIMVFISPCHVKMTKLRAFTLSSSIMFRCGRKILAQIITHKFQEEWKTNPQLKYRGLTKQVCSDNLETHHR